MTYFRITLSPFHVKATNVFANFPLADKLSRGAVTWAMRFSFCFGRGAFCAVSDRCWDNIIKWVSLSIVVGSWAPEVWVQGVGMGLECGVCFKSKKNAKLPVV